MCQRRNPSITPTLRSDDDQSVSILLMADISDADRSVNDSSLAEQDVGRCELWLTEGCDIAGEVVANQFETDALGPSSPRPHTRL